MSKNRRNSNGDVEIPITFEGRNCHQNNQQQPRPDARMQRENNHQQPMPDARMQRENNHQQPMPDARMQRENLYHKHRPAERDHQQTTPGNMTQSQIIISNHERIHIMKEWLDRLANRVTELEKKVPPPRSMYMRDD